MSRFANLSSKESNDGFQVYSRRPQRYQQDRYQQDRYQSSFTNTLIKKEEKIITEEKFPQLSTSTSKKDQPKKETPILNYILPIINYKEKVEVIPQEIKPEIIKESEKPFTHDEAQKVFEKMVSSWKDYEDEYISEYGEQQYIKIFGDYIFSSQIIDSESEISDEEIDE